MQEIELACFKDSAECIYISDREKFSIKDQNELYQLEIRNNSDSDCDLDLLINSKKDFPENTKLQIFSEKELFFNQNLEKIVEKTINLAKIKKKTSKIYNFDFKNTENDEISFKFDINLQFSCKNEQKEEEFKEIPIISTKSATSSTKINKNTKQITGQVLGQSHSLQETKTPEEKSLEDFKLKIFPYLILLLALIFVIMIFVNGKKQKKNLQKKEKKF